MGQAYVVSILDNCSRAILASAITPAQDTNVYLSVLHDACTSAETREEILRVALRLFKVRQPSVSHNLQGFRLVLRRSPRL